MYQPNYTITNALLKNIVALEMDRATLEYRTLPYNVRSKLADQAKALNLFHLAHMLGLSLTLKDAEKLAEGRKLPIEDQRGFIITNFRNVLEFNRSNAATSYTELDITLLLHLNKIVLTNWRETWDVKLRTEKALLDPDMEKWQQFADEFLEPDRITPELNDLLSWFSQTNGKVNNLIRIAVVIYRMVEILPFSSGNRLTIIALADFLLTRYGYTAKTNLAITRNFDQYEDEYKQAWELTKRSVDVTTWLEKFTQNLSKDVNESKSEAEEVLNQEEEKTAKQPFLDLNKRQLKVLRYLQSIPTVKREDYCQMMDVSTMTAYRDLNELVRKKLLKVDGKGRGTKYMLGTR